MHDSIRSARGSAPITLVAGAMLSGLIGWFHDVPLAWTHAELLGELDALHGFLAPLGVLLLKSLPGGLLAMRMEAAAMAAISVTALLAGWVAGRLCTGPGRGWVHGLTPCFVSAALLPQLHASSAHTVLTNLLASFPALLAVGGMKPPPPKRPLRQDCAVLLASFGCLADLHHGIISLVLTVGIAWLSQMADEARRSCKRQILTALLPAAVAGTVWTLLGPGKPWTWPSLDFGQRVDLQGLITPLVLLGIGALALLGLALRHHAAAVLLLFIVLGQWVTLGHDPLVPPTIAGIVLSIAAASLIWCVARLGKHHAVQLGLSSAAALVMLGFIMAHVPLDTTPIAERRSLRTLIRAYDRGLIAPGDAVFAFGEWQDVARHAEVHEGWRPDLQIVDARRLSGDEFLRLTILWDAAGRRILSDSFSAATRWDPASVVDSGPLFWFIGRGPIADPEFTDLKRFEASPAAEDPSRLAWVNLQIERFRFRRTLGEIEAALFALPLTAARRRGLLTRLQLARSVRPTPSAASELRSSDNASTPTNARIAAECADLLYAYGEHGRATELFIEAAEQGSSEALAALARWQFRAGQESEAQATLGWLASERDARAQTIALGRWLLDRNRWDDARTLLRRVRDTPAEHASAEIALRLRMMDHP